MSISTLTAFFHAPVTGRLSLVTLSLVFNKDPVSSCSGDTKDTPQDGYIGIPYLDPLGFTLDTTMVRVCVWPSGRHLVGIGGERKTGTGK